MTIHHCKNSSQNKVICIFNTFTSLGAYMIKLIYFILQTDDKRKKE